MIFAKKKRSEKRWLVTFGWLHDCLAAWLVSLESAIFNSPGVLYSCKEIRQVNKESMNSWSLDNFAPGNTRLPVCCLGAGIPEFCPDYLLPGSRLTTHPILKPQWSLLCIGLLPSRVLGCTISWQLGILALGDVTGMRIAPLVLFPISSDYAQRFFRNNVHSGWWGRVVRSEMASSRQERKALPSSQFLEFLLQLTSMTLWIDFKASFLIGRFLELELQT